MRALHMARSSLINGDMNGSPPRLVAKSVLSNQARTQSQMSNMDQNSEKKNEQAEKIERYRKKIMMGKAAKSEDRRE